VQGPVRRWRSGPHGLIGCGGFGRVARTMPLWHFLRPEFEEYARRQFARAAALVLVAADPSAGNVDQRRLPKGRVQREDVSAGFQIGRHGRNAFRRQRGGIRQNEHPVLPGAQLRRVAEGRRIEFPDEVTGSLELCGQPIGKPGVLTGRREPRDAGDVDATGRNAGEQQTQHEHRARTPYRST